MKGAFAPFIIYIMEDTMDECKFQQIKEKALEDHIPIIMDDTLEEIKKLFQGQKIHSILEIGTAVRIFCNMLF